MPKLRRWIAAPTLAMVVAGCSGSPGASPGASLATSSSPSAAASVPPPPPSAAVSWAVTDLPLPGNVAPCTQPDGGLQNLQVAAFGAGILALGSCAHSASPSLVWLSADGRAWQAAAPTALLHADVYELLVSDGLAIAVGQDVADGATAAAWTSHDGLIWSRSAGDLGCGVMSSIVRVGPAFVAFGNRAPEIPEFGGPSGVCEWTSTDGISWTRVSLSSTVFPDHTVVAGVAAGPGGLIAVGTDSGPVRSSAAVWRSPDGRAWTRTDAAWAGDWFSIDAVVARAAGFLLLGSDAHGNAALATSPDGLTWTPAPAPGQGTLSGGPTLAEGPAGLVFGGTPINGYLSPTTVWTSSDGSSWAPAPSLPPGPTASDGLAYHAVAVVGGSFVLAASTADGDPVLLTLEQP